MEKLYTIVIVLLMAIVDSYAQPALNPRELSRNEFWNFSALTATFAESIISKRTIS